MSVWRVPSKAEWISFLHYINDYQKGGGVKYYNGEDWLERNVNRYDGTNWQEVFFKQYDGTDWVLTLGGNYSYRYDNTHGWIGKSLANTSGWDTSSTAGDPGNDQESNNATGFTAKGGGFRFPDGWFDYLGWRVFFWSSTLDEEDEEKAATLYWGFNGLSTYTNNYYHNYGFSVRLVRDYTGSDADGTIYEDDYVGNDGKKYDGIKLGDWVWLAENLKETKYADDTTIPEITDDTDWGSDTDGAWCKYANDSDNYDEYGALYNFHAVDNAKDIVAEQT